MNENTELEILKQEARDDLLFYIQACDPSYIASDLHVFLAGILQDVAMKRRRRVIISVAPRVGKSRLVTTELSTWVLGRNPERAVAITSYGQVLSNTHSRNAMRRMTDPTYRTIFPDVRLNPNNQTVADWSTTKGGRLRATGIGGGLTGLPNDIDLLIVDDPVKDFKEAHSQVVCDAIWEWFWSVAYTRLAPDGCVVIIQTRWSRDDLVGRLTDPVRQAEISEASHGHKWEVFSIPALAEADDPLGREPGESVFPEKFSVEKYNEIKASVGSYVWSALYMQSPTVRGGNYIRTDNFQIIQKESVPPDLQWVRAWDLAASEKKSADYTASVRVAQDCNGNLYVADGINGRWEWPAARQRIANVATAERVPIGIETVAGFKTAYANLMEVIPTTLICREYTPDKDKLTRALPWIALVERKMVFLVAGDWTVEFLSQCEAFPSEQAHDDFVDALSLGFTMLTAGGFFAPLRIEDRFSLALKARRDRTIQG
jgi:predicted phage terminase large subunit-like protein